MGLLDGILGSVTGGGGGITDMIQQQVAGAIASKMGIDPSMAQMAISALTQNHSIPGDTVQQAAAQTGMSGDILSQIMGHIGGDSALGQLAGAVTGQQQSAEASGGGIMDAVTGALGGLMGGKS